MSEGRKREGAFFGFLLGGCLGAALEETAATLAAGRSGVCKRADKDNRFLGMLVIGGCCCGSKEEVGGAASPSSLVSISHVLEAFLAEDVVPLVDRMYRRRKRGEEERRLHCSWVCLAPSTKTHLIFFLLFSPVPLLPPLSTLLWYMSVATFVVPSSVF